MKTTITTFFTLCLVALPAFAQQPPASPEPAAPVPAMTNLPAPAPVAPAVADTNAPAVTNLPPADVFAATNAVTEEAQPPVPVQTTFIPPEKPVGTNNPDALLMNFRNAPLEMVLGYLSDAAGFVIVLDTQVRGTVNIMSSQPMNRDEAIVLLNSVLNKNGYAVIRDGRTLTVVDKAEARLRDIPVRSGNRPEDIPKTAEIVTQIIPIRFVEARQLASDLTLFVSPQATIIANEAGNSLVITDTQQNIRHLTEIIRAIDNSAEAETEIRVFHLKHASPLDVVASLEGVFPSGSGTQSPIRFGGQGGGGRSSRGGGNMGGGPGAFFAQMMAGAGGSSSNDRVRKAQQVSAVADLRIQAVIVTAPKDLIEQIDGMIKELDVPSDRDQKVYVFQMKTGDPEKTAQVLQSMFQGSTRGGSTTQNSPLEQRRQNAATTSGATSSSTSRTSSGGRSGGATGLQF